MLFNIRMARPASLFGPFSCQIFIQRCSGSIITAFPGHRPWCWRGCWAACGRIWEGPAGIVPDAEHPSHTGAMSDGTVPATSPDEEALWRHTSGGPVYRPSGSLIPFAEMFLKALQNSLCVLPCGDPSASCVPSKHLWLSCIPSMVEFFWTWSLQQLPFFQLSLTRVSTGLWISRQPSGRHNCKDVAWWLRQACAAALWAG